MFVTTQKKGAINRLLKLATKASSQGFLYDSQMKGEAYWTVFFLWDQTDSSYAQLLTIIWEVTVK